MLIRQHLKRHFRGREVNTQASYAVPLALGIFEDGLRNRIVKNFAATISGYSFSDKGVLMPPYSLMTGFIGTAWISAALSTSGHTDLAYRQLLQTRYPSWLYPATQGATTIWERLNSYTREDGFGGNNNMNSFNHYSFGAVGAWMQAYALGIQRDEEAPGFKHFVLAPEPDPTGGLAYARRYYDSMYGRIESAWKITGPVFEYRFHVPANTSATLRLRAASSESISIIKGKKTMRGLGPDNGRFAFFLRSGDYQIQVKRQ